MTDTTTAPVAITTNHSPRVALITDHSSEENSRTVLQAAITKLTGHPGVSLDAREFMSGSLRAESTGTGLVLHGDRIRPVEPDVVVVYEIHPSDRDRFAHVQSALHASRVPCLGADNPQAWRNATNKVSTTTRFTRAGIRHARTIALSATTSDALAAFTRLGGDAWARPTTGLGGRDVFHIDCPARLLAAARHYATTTQDWLLSADARNFDRYGRRHQFRVVVLSDRVLRVCEHIQDNPDAPCNEAMGARSHLLAPESLPPHLAQLAIAATRSLGLVFGGVDLCAEQGGMVFEVNVHPVLDVPAGLQTVAIPLVRAHLGAAGGAGWESERRSFSRAIRHASSEERVSLLNPDQRRPAVSPS